jgi:hypothetical protein
MQKIILLAVFTIISTLVFSQTKKAKVWMVNNVIAADLKTVSSNNVEFSITENKDDANVVARGIKSEGVKGCTNCNVSGKVKYSSTYAQNPKGEQSTLKTTGVKNVKVILGKDPSSSSKTIYTATVDEDGNFGFSNIPAGKYLLKIGEKVIAKGWVIK